MTVALIIACNSNIYLLSIREPMFIMSKVKNSNCICFSTQNTFKSDSTFVFKYKACFIKIANKLIERLASRLDKFYKKILFILKVRNGFKVTLGAYTYNKEIMTHGR